MSLNSNVLIPKGIPAADRVAMLGHSIQTNLMFYCFAQKDYLDNVRELLDSQYENDEGTPETDPFSEKRKAQKYWFLNISEPFKVMRKMGLEHVFDELIK